MSEEYCDGVKILLKRMESNPEEFKHTSKWNHLLPKQAGGFSDWTHALSPEEIQALHDGIRKVAQGLFTERVMATLLEDKEEVARRTVGGGGIDTTYQGWNDPRMLAQNSFEEHEKHIEAHKMAQNAYNPYGVTNSSIEQRRIAQEIKDLGLFSILKAKFKNL